MSWYVKKTRIDYDPEYIAAPPDEKLGNYDIKFGELEEFNESTAKKQIQKIMTKRQYQFFVERFVLGKKIKEIADEYRVNPSTVSRTINRGLERCRKMLVLNRGRPG